jgi:endonuclease-8
MPEGDTLHRTANRLRPALVGGALTRFEAARLLGDRPTLGTTVTGVEAVGKHLLIDFSDGLSLRTHLGMPGSWHLYREGERWRKPRHLLRALVVVPGWEAACFSAPQVQTYRRDRPGGPLGTARDPLGHLGPDLCLADVDLDEAVRRFATVPEPDEQIGPALLDQRIAAGIGNVYKSEVLHRLRVDPFVAVADVPVEVRRQLLEVASRLLRFNLTTTRRTTVAGPPGSVAVYGRARQPCRSCGTPIRMARQGAQARSTYWCPRCQPPGAVGQGASSSADRSAAPRGESR